MPILWRYLLFSFLRTWLLSVCSFVLILLVSRFKEVARFGAISSSPEKTALFAIAQIPIILPIAIPLSALIAALLLFQRLSKSFELTAFRASGIPIGAIFGPVIITSIFLSFVNFALSAEVAPYCRRYAKELVYYKTTQNPLVLLQRQHLIKAKDFYVNMRLGDSGDSAKHVFMISHNQKTGTLSLLNAKKLVNTDSSMEGHDVAWISHLSGDEETFDPLIIENQSWMTMDANALTASLKKHRPRIDPASLELPMLQIRDKGKTKIGKKNFVEICRRIHLSLAVFTFTLLGSAYGIEHTRSLSRNNLFIALGLALCLMISYLLGKEFKGTPLIALMVFFLPHPILWFVSIQKVRTR